MRERLKGAASQVDLFSHSGATELFNLTERHAFDDQSFVGRYPYGMVPLPVIGAETGTELRELGEAIVNELPDGVIRNVGSNRKTEVVRQSVQTAQNREAILEDLRAPEAS